ncbi:MAG TPA: NAD(P)-binding protein [Streptosporangiaceae bacterium]
MAKTPSGSDGQSEYSDAELGMHRTITRRDFFDGVALAAGGAALASVAGCGYGDPDPGRISPEHIPDDLPHPSYPPDLTGLRGQTPAALSVPHSLRDNTFWDATPDQSSTGEHYDLVVVGAGISGLATAYFWHQRNPRARILILDNHDDFGGHARRNEFQAPGRPEDGGLLIGYGGTQAIDTPSAYSKQAMGLLKDVGIEVQEFTKFYDAKFYERWKVSDDCTFFDKDTFGRDYLAVNRGGSAHDTYKDAPLDPQALRDLVMLYDDPKDWMPGLSDEEKKNRLAGVTYEQFLTRYAKVHPQVLQYVHTMSCDEWGYPMDTLSALDAWATDDGWPGFDGMGLKWTKEPPKYVSKSLKWSWGHDDPYIYHFPDGNASIARSLVRAMIPQVAPRDHQHSMRSIVLDHFDYGQLDRPGRPVRIRLSSPVVKAQHQGDPMTSGTVNVGYYADGGVRTLTASNVVMACWNAMVPYLCPELGPDQAQALHEGVKVPLLYGNVVVRNWRPWVEMGAQVIRFTGGFWAVAQLDYPVSMGGYEFTKDPSQPAVVQMIAVPTQGGMAPSDGGIAGRQVLYKTPFSYLERAARDALVRAVGPGGFDPARDIEAITVNRWAHGYAREYCRPWDSFWPDGPLPADIGRQRVGRIAIANSDSVPRAYTDAAIDAAWRAVNDLHGT